MWIRLVQHNKQYHVNILLNKFTLNAHILGFHVQTTTNLICQDNLAELTGAQNKHIKP